ncbi:pentapeptide repeat-containing protein [Alteromonas sp. a30]|uniref:pentapeptide repeat-containing protein n=1 Tax=Alteromonas sp. a30 TaxID=2730917 RepID=UPI002281905E|nr:hypothetical protein [Alteromonas sp. a30]MCY7293993.1 hypothetical protein [Alteromonas sp. a30]
MDITLIPNPKSGQLERNKQKVASAYSSDFTSNSNKLYNLEAVQLWLQGREAWNQWVNENPECDVDFSEVDFGYLRKFTERGEIDFSFYNFPKGDIDFSEVEFGDGNMSFSRSNFGDGNMSFSRSNFGNGNTNFSKTNFGNGKADFSFTHFGDGSADFSETNFGDGNVNFFEANFGDGRARFYGANFGDGYVNFSNANFGDGSASFYGANFGDGSASFYGANFGDGSVNFSDANFGDGSADFSGANFGDGYVNFSYANFGNGIADFSRTNFSNGDVDFIEANFGDGSVDFSDANFGDGSADFSGANFAGGHVSFIYTQSNGNVVFIDLRKPDKITSFSLLGASINGLLSLSNNTFHCVPDLTETNIKHDVELQTLSVNLQRERLDWKGLWMKKALDTKDIQRLRKLKQIAENNKHHEAALRFHADEMRAKRWHKKEDGGLGVFGSVLDLLYSAICNYGQSIAKPLITLIATWFAFFPLYWTLTKDVFTKDTFAAENVADLFVFTATNSIPFIPVAKKVRDIAYASFFDESALLFSVMSFQAIVSLACIFLIGLGFRNRFRI